MHTQTHMHPGGCRGVQLHGGAKHTCGMVGCLHLLLPVGQHVLICCVGRSIARLLEAAALAQLVQLVVVGGQQLARCV